MYFSHDVNALNDIKIQKMMVDLGYAGYGVYWALIELMHKEGGALSLKDLKIFSKILKISTKFLENLIKNFELFEIKNDLFYSKRVIKNIENINKNKQQKIDAAKSRWSKKDDNKEEKQKEEKQENIENNDNISNVKNDAVAYAVALEKNNADEMLYINKNKNKNINNNMRLSNDNLLSADDESPPTTTFDYFKNIWNKKMQNILPSVSLINKNRKQKIKTRITNNKIFLNDFEKCLDIAINNKFLLGDNKNNWKMTFDWIIENDTNYLKILEGNYSKNDSKNFRVAEDKNIKKFCGKCEGGFIFDEENNIYKQCACNTHVFNIS